MGDKKTGICVIGGIGGKEGVRKQFFLSPITKRSNLT